jgi:hypothetical protein
VLFRSGNIAMIRIVCCTLMLVACGGTAKAGDCCDPCDHCGCQSGCRKVCRLVCETKKVPKVTYSCECEDFCVPGPSNHCVVCDECGNKKHVYTPTCAEVRTRTKLVKHETMEEVPTHKWVVETVCDRCAGQCNADAAPQAGGPSGLQPLPAPANSNEAPGFAGQLRRVLPAAFGRK